MVTLCAVSSVALPQTLRALNLSTAGVDFGAVKLFSDVRPPLGSADIECVTIPPIRSRADYSCFMLKELKNHVSTSHVLVVQWDGYILNATAWMREFLEVDYIGAPWPQFADHRKIGNGGFSLRSRRLLQACADQRILCDDAEDIAIGRTYRDLLEGEFGLVFASEALANRFAYERSTPNGDEFGFHGVFNMPAVTKAAALQALLKTVEDGVIGERECEDLLVQAWNRRAPGLYIVVARRVCRMTTGLIPLARFFWRAAKRRWSERKIGRIGGERAALPHRRTLF